MMDDQDKEYLIQKKWRLCGLLILVYSILIFSGGVIGFVLKQSRMSLAAGSLFGLLLLFTSALTLSERKAGLYTALVLSILLTVLFGIRFSSGFHFLPSGLLLFISALMVTLLRRTLRSIKAQLA
ncbi:MAG: TMEM14 family protein [Chlamydiota bacterium]